MKAYTDLEQSKKLAEILPIETADMRYAPFGDTHPWFGDITLIEKDAIPCWSLAALLEILKYPDLQKTDDNWYCCKSFHGSTIVADGGHTAVDACVNVIIKFKNNFK